MAVESFITLGSALTPEFFAQVGNIFGGISHFDVVRNAR